MRRHGDEARAWRRALVALTAGALLLAAAPAQADPQDSIVKEVALGSTAAITSLVYGPVKLVYALGGLLVGGIAWTFSAGDSDVSGPILDASVRGDYVITQDILRGRKDLEFIGRSPASSRARQEMDSGF